MTKHKENACFDMLHYIRVAVKIYKWLLDWLYLPEENPPIIIFWDFGICTRCKIRVYVYLFLPLFAFSFWDKGQPDNWDYRENGEDCGQIHSSAIRKRKLWNDADCNLAYPYICETKAWCERQWTCPSHWTLTNMTGLICWKIMAQIKTEGNDVFDINVLILRVTKRDKSCIYSTCAWHLLETTKH